MTLLEYIRTNLPDSIMTTEQDEDNRFGLPYPYTVPSPGDIFDCMFYWDTHFANVGLLADGQIQQAVYNTDNIRHLIQRFGYMPNSSKRHHLGQSQPPLYYRMVSDIFDITGNTKWLESHYDTISKEYDFWMTKRITPNGLNHYGNAERAYQEEEIRTKFQYAKSRFVGLDSQNLDEMKAAVRTVAVLCESGWDCCYRFEMSGFDYNPVDLNALLYGLETSMSRFSRILNRREDNLWCDRAAQRKERMDRYLWSNDLGFYTDWNFVSHSHSPVVSCASLFPLYVGLDHDPKSIIAILKNDMMLPFGVTGTVKTDHPYTLQWEYPNVWAPLQYVAYQACLRAGENDLARDIAARYCNLLENSYAETGGLWEKYNGFTGQVNNAEYASPPMLGWTAGAYLFFSHIMKNNT